MGQFRMSHYTQHLPPSGFEQKASFPWYSGKYINSATPLVEPGSYWELTGKNREAGGNAFMYVKFTANVTVGQLVTPAAPTADTVASSGSTVSTVKLTSGGLTAGAEIGNFAFVANSTSSGSGSTIREIIANTTDTLTLAAADYQIPSSPTGADSLLVAPTSGDVVVIYRPFQVRVCTAALVPCGLALGSGTSGQYGVVQVSGLGLFSAVGNGTALAVAIPAVPSAAGVIIGGNSTANAFVGPNIVPLQATSAASAIIPCLFNFRGTL